MYNEWTHDSSIYFHKFTMYIAIHYDIIAMYRRERKHGLYGYNILKLSSKHNKTNVCKNERACTCRKPFFLNLLHVNEMAKKVVVYWFFSSQSSTYCYKIIKDCLKKVWPLHRYKNVFMNAIIQSFIGQVVWVIPSCSLRSLGGVLKELNQSIKTKIKKMVVLEFLKTRN